MRYLVFCLCLVGACFAMSSRKPLQEKKVEAPISKPVDVDVVDNDSSEDIKKQTTAAPEVKKKEKKTGRDQKDPTHQLLDRC